LNTKNIIFDLGNVILPIDYTLSNQAFEKLLVNSGKLNTKITTKITTSTYFNPLFQQLEKGLISEQNFYENFCENFGIKASFEEIEHAWNALLLPFPKKNIKFLEMLQAQSKYKIFLLSNTNSIHARAFEQDFLRQFGYDFKTLFAYAYYSQDMGKRKPDADIFLQVLSEQNILPQETLFVDDNLDNRNTALSLGINVFATQKADDLLDLFIKP
jgi:glucose-1-phosphatase